VLENPLMFLSETSSSLQDNHSSACPLPFAVLLQVAFTCSILREKSTCSCARIVSWTSTPSETYQSTHRILQKLAICFSNASTEQHFMLHGNLPPTRILPVYGPPFPTWLEE
jgi:hypothetical protein